MMTQNIGNLNGIQEVGGSNPPAGANNYSGLRLIIMFGLRPVHHIVHLMVCILNNNSIYLLNLEDKVLDKIKKFDHLIF